jgi:hypothetical protein
MRFKRIKTCLNQVTLESLKAFNKRYNIAKACIAKTKVFVASYEDLKFFDKNHQNDFFAIIMFNSRIQ